MERALPKTLQNAIAKKHSAIVEQGWSEQDGFFSDHGFSHWVYLKPGYYNVVVDVRLHIIHEPTVKEVLYQLANVQPCDCDECQKLLKR